MLNNKLTDLLADFSPYERNSFKKFVASPYYNEQDILIKLLKVLQTDFKKYGYIKLNKEQIWRKVYGKTTFNNTKFKRICSDLTQLGVQFLATQAFHKQDNIFYNTALETIGRRQLQKFYTTLNTKAQNAQRQAPIRDSEFFHQQYRYELTSNMIQSKSINREGMLQIFSAVKQLDYYYITQKLTHFCEICNYQQILRLTNAADLNLMDDIIEFVELQEEKKLLPVVAIYFNIAQTFIQQEADVYYFKLKKLLQQHIGLFEKAEAWTMYGYAQNYCIRKINTGHNNFLQEIFELYQDALSQEVMLDNGELSPWHYKNIVVVGLRLKAFNWVEQFINEYKHLLPENFRENAHTYNMAKLYFYRKDYSKVIELLREVEYQDVFYQLDARSMLMKTYYLLQEEEALYSLFASFKIMLLRNKKISPHHRTNYQNFIRFVEKLLKVSRNDPQAINKLHNDIKACKQLADVSWLMEQVKSLQR